VAGRSPGAGEVRDALAAASDAMAAAGVPTPRIDAEALLAGITGRPAAELIADREAHLEPAESRAFSEAVRRRLRREPVAYILGHKGFRHIELEVDRRVLVPRPETEMLVEVALSLDPSSVLEIGTGSGAVALAVADEIPACRVTAGDASADALAVAGSNARRLGLADRVSFFEGTWPQPGRFDLIVANLPYVATGDELPPEVRDWEPSSALFAGESGLEAFEQVLDSLDASGVRAPAIALEIGHGQADEVSALVRGAGFGSTRLLRDLAGLERVVLGHRPGSAS
jgi:release factor glutamine methyltransferase